MPTVKPRNPDKTRTFKQEVQIADKNYKKDKTIGYEFNNGRRLFDDKVDKDGYE